MTPLTGISNSVNSGLPWQNAQTAPLDRTISLRNVLTNLGDEAQANPSNHFNPLAGGRGTCPCETIMPSIRGSGNHTVGFQTHQWRGSEKGRPLIIITCFCPYVPRDLQQTKEKARPGKAPLSKVNGKVLLRYVHKRTINVTSFFFFFYL